MRVGCVPDQFIIKYFREKERPREVELRQYFSAYFIHLLPDLCVQHRNSAKTIGENVLHFLHILSSPLHVSLQSCFSRLCEITKDSIFTLSEKLKKEYVANALASTRRERSNNSFARLLPGRLIIINHNVTSVLL